MDNRFYILGFVVGITDVVALMFIKKFTCKTKRNDFDERQQVARGKAFQTGFFTCVASISIAMIFVAFLGESLTTKNFIFILISILMISILSTTIQLIWTDSYISFRNKPTSNMVLFFALSILQISLFFLGNDDFTSYPALFVGIGLGIIGINMAIKILYDKKHIGEDEESIEA